MVCPSFGALLDSITMSGVEIGVLPFDENIHAISVLSIYPFFSCCSYLILFSDYLIPV
jgi:hypothetical protein